LIARNGAGKTSLLDILTGREQPDSGQVVMRKGLEIGFLMQEPELDPELSIEQTILSGDKPILRVLENYQQALNDPEDTDGMQSAYDAMDAHQAWDFETRYTQTLSKLGLDDLQQQVKQLSGGQRKRLALAEVLLRQPDMLVLDEPTNHLDLGMIEWLEQWLNKEKISLFLVTHDRYLLDRVCTEILELDQGKLYSYKGNYAYFLEKRTARLESEASAVAKAKQLYKGELEWMRRQPKARTTKSKSRIDDFFKIKAIAHQRRKDHQVQLELNMERLGTKVVELHGISKRFGQRQVLNPFDYRFQRGERVGLVGPNGSGKSTLLNMVTGGLEPDTGKVVIGETVHFGYYGQSGLEVKPGQKVIDVIRAYGDYIPLKKGRQLSASQLLERFLFDRKKQYDYVEKLSGGERKRLYLCTVLIGNPNFLILDEPTNDLDIVTLNVLENFLLDYPGCLVVVSHDRYFMDKIVDHLLVFDGQGGITDFPGNYSDYRAYESSSPPKSEKQDNGPSEAAQEYKASKTKASLSYLEQKELKKLEREIEKLEEERSRLETGFADGSISGDQIDEQSIALSEIIQAIEKKSDRWLELEEKRGL
jgi:ATP-binding cassette subfamily F protein uup